MRNSLCFIGALTLALGISLSAHAASSLILDRGLPTANLNNDAGEDRSNVAWGFEGDYLSGDVFNLSGVNDFEIDDLTLWYVNDLNTSNTDFTLWLGSDTTQPLTATSTNATASRVQYVNGEDYQGSSGNFLEITQLTFEDVGLRVSNDTDYYFTVSAVDSSAGLITPLFLHASNAGLSGSTQEGADDEYNWFDWNSGAPTLGGSINSDGSGWDKPSDINVQITGSVVPVPPAFALGMVGIAGVGLAQRFRKKRAQ